MMKDKFSVPFGLIKRGKFVKKEALVGPKKSFEFLLTRTLISVSIPHKFVSLEKSCRLFSKSHLSPCDFKGNS